jgi:hypothetical protein
VANTDNTSSKTAPVMCTAKTPKTPKARCGRASDVLRGAGADGQREVAKL